MQNRDASQGIPPPRPLPRQFDVNLLELFDCIYRTRNLTAAGARLGLSQPTVSRGLARLRGMYNDTLFVRQQHGVVATPFADGIAESVAAFLEIVRNSMERTAFEPVTAQRDFTVVMSDIGERYALPRLLRFLTANAPGVRLKTVALPQSELVAGLASGDIDFAFGFYEDLDPQLHELRLFRERFVYVARHGHPSVQGALRAGQLRELPHVIGSPVGTRLASVIEKLLSSPSVCARIALRVRSFQAVGPIVASTDMVAAIPSSLADLIAAHLQLQVVPPPIDMPEYDVSLVWHGRLQRDPAFEWIKTLFTELFAGQLATFNVDR